uniref:Uncharacterized protein n=1 Tax=Romanomermis culicivorax TaxID=13658 RepID=A0A915HG13_ROMCU
MYKYCSPWTSTMCTSNGCPADNRRMMGGGSDKNLTLFQLIRCSMGWTAPAPGGDSDCPKQTIEATDVNNVNYDVNQFINEAVGWVKKKIGVE